MAEAGRAAARARQPGGASAPAAPALDQALRAALLREIARTWRQLNATFFKAALAPPVIRLSDSARLLGRWYAPHRTIELSERMVLTASWGSVLEVLKHEMAHQYVDEVLGATEETAHGPAFRQVCARMGIDAAASGEIAAPTGEDGQRSRLLKRIHDLLALAGSSNRHEAQTAAAMAHRLMLKHNIEVAERSGARHYRYAHLGRPTGRVPEHEHILAAILAEHFFVEAIWVPAFRPEDGKRGSVLEICGTRENVAMAEHVHAFLRETAERLWAEHKRAHQVRSNRDRRGYCSGVMEGFRERLAAEKASCRQQGLVWVGDADLRRYHRQRHPYVRHVRLQGSRGAQARSQGREAGRRIVLRRGLEDGSSGPSAAGPRALPLPGRRGSSRNT